MPETVTRDAVIAAVREFLKQDAVIAEDVNLFKAGILDSLHIVSLVTFLEQRFACSLDYDELTEENLSTLGSVGDLVSRKKAR